MSQITPNIPDLDRKGLRVFGLVTGAIVAGLFGLFFPWLLEASLPIWPWVVFGVLGAWALVAPMSLKPVYRVWMRLGLLLGKVTTPIIMGAIFVLLFVPMAFFLRLIRWDAMHRAFDKNASSYRVPSRKMPKEHLEKPF